MPAHSYLQEITSHFRNISKQSWRMLRSSLKRMHWPREWDKYVKINVSLNRKIFLSGSILLLNKTAWCLNDFKFKSENRHMFFTCLKPLKECQVKCILYIFSYQIILSTVKMVDL